MRKLLLAVLLATCVTSVGAADKVVVQYDCIPNYANWGGVTAEYSKFSGVRVPPDMKGSSATMAALEAEKANPCNWPFRAARSTRTSSAADNRPPAGAGKTIAP